VNTRRLWKVGGFLGAAVTAAGAALNDGDFVSYATVWPLWWLADAAASLLIAPLIITWGAETPSREVALEAAVAGPMNAAFEKPISACHSKYAGKVPEGTLNSKVEAETTKIIKLYLKTPADHETAWRYHRSNSIITQCR